MVQWHKYTKIILKIQQIIKHSFITWADLLITIHSYQNWGSIAFEDSYLLGLSCQLWGKPRVSRQLNTGKAVKIKQKQNKAVRANYTLVSLSEESRERKQTKLCKAHETQSTSKVASTSQ